MVTIVKSPRSALIAGIVLYLICLWRGCPHLEDKAYFLAIWVLGIFAIAAHRQAAQASFAALCRLVLLLTSGLLLVGIWNMPLALAYKILAVAAWFSCMYGAALWPRRVLSN
ncbi:MAG: hypothetical protein ACK5JN_04560 [Kluyvera sp.]|uniref:hypothetical protein n=1 Tax=Kluyvera sp. TaxID=1538228 RepID=UPI003A8745AB